MHILNIRLILDIDKQTYVNRYIFIYFLMYKFNDIYITHALSIHAHIHWNQGL